MSYARSWEEVTAVGSNGICIQVNNSIEMVALKLYTPFAAHKPDFVAGTSNALVEMGFTPELEAFVDAIAFGSEVPSSIEESLHSMQIIDAIQRSVISQKQVDV